MSTSNLDRLLAAASDFDASDLHLVAGVPPAFRVNGEIIIADEDALSEAEVERIAYSLLNEQQRRLYAGLESIKLGRGGDTLLADLLDLDAHTVARGRQQLLNRDVASSRTRREGGGRVPTEKKLPK